MSKSLQGKNIFITGGSRGIGAGIVQHVAQAGANVIFTYASNEQSAQEVLKSLPAGNHHILKMNLGDEASVTDACNKVTELFSQVDGVVNNAGITKDQLLVRMKTEDFDSVINTNLRGSFLICRHFAKTMMKARTGAFVNITSIIGQTGNAGQANYAASKAGLEAFTKSLALELATRSVRANCIAPGYIETEMTGVLSDDVKSKILAKIPMNSIGQAADIAKAAIFLLSDDSKYITGQTIGVNGGMYLG